MGTQQRVEEKAADLRNSYDNCSIRVTDVGAKTVGIGVKVLREGLVEIELDSILEDIDRELYDDGYNTAWIVEDAYLKSHGKSKEEWASQSRVGMIAAVPLEYGEPKMPVLDSELTSSWRNTYRN